MPFDDGPGVLVVWDGSYAGDATTAMSGSLRDDAGPSVHTETALDDDWKVELEPTLDNRWGDFARPIESASVPIERWEFGHRTEEPGEDGIAFGWTSPDHDDAGWRTAHATFGPHGLQTRPAASGSLPTPAQSLQDFEPDETWLPATYSLSRGIHKDRLHGGTFGPKGHVPEEFLDFGRVARGEAVQFRTVISLSASPSAHLALGAPARKRVWINGAEVPGQDDGYHLLTPVSLDEGPNLVEFRLEAEDEVELRAHFALVSSPARYARPELIRAGDGTQKDSVVAYRKTVPVPSPPVRAVVQVGCDAPCRLYVNGELAGRQGGFDPYFEAHHTRLQPYDVTASMRDGENEVVIEVSDLGLAHAVSVDGLVETEGGSVTFVSGEGWEVTRDSETVPLAFRRQPFGAIYPWGDPAMPHLWRRPHPLPRTSWLEDSRDAEATVVDLAPDARRKRRDPSSGCASRFRRARSGWNWPFTAPLRSTWTARRSRVLRARAPPERLRIDLPPSEAPEEVVRAACGDTAGTPDGRDSGRSGPVRGGPGNHAARGLGGSWSGRIQRGRALQQGVRVDGSWHRDTILAGPGASTWDGGGQRQRGFGGGEDLVSLHLRPDGPPLPGTERTGDQGLQHRSHPTWML